MKQNNQLTRIKMLLDNILSPPENYANFTYFDRYGRHWRHFLSGKDAFKNAFHILRLSYMIGLSYVLWPLAYLLKKNGYRFVDIDLSQIGTIFYLDLLLREGVLNTGKPTAKNKVLVLASHYKDGNHYLLNLYKPYVTLVRNPVLKFLLSPLFVSNVFQDNSFRFDSVYFSKPIAHNVWNEYAKEHDAPLIHLPEADKKKAQDLLENYLPEGQKFVTLHVRDSGFYGDTDRTTRNADIRTYQKAIQYLIDKGFAVVRIGDPNSVSIEEMVKDCGPLLFDYAHSDIKSEFMDCYLLSESEFLIGAPSGPVMVTMLFNVQSCNVNWNNVSHAPHFVEGDIATIKKVCYIKDQTLVPFEKLFQPPLSQNPNQQTLEKHGLYYENNSEEEILNTVKEFIEIPRDQVSSLQEKAREYIGVDHYALGAKGNFSNTILECYRKDIDADQA